MGYDTAVKPFFLFISQNASIWRQLRTDSVHFGINVSDFMSWQINTSLDFGLKSLFFGNSIVGTEVYTFRYLFIK
jgi:hypothetical protein